MKKSNKKYNIFNYFKWYEIVWWITIVSAGFATAFLLPDAELSQNTILVVSSLIAVVGGTTCELLISKQSRWNFIVSIVLVEITEIIICFTLKYYASMVITIVFWLPIDIYSFIVWNKNKDKSDESLTVVKKLSIAQTLWSLVIMGLFAGVVGYLLTLVGGEDTYIDALTSAFGMANGILILLRYREQWFAWYIYTILEAVLWVLSGNYIMLVLSVGYLTNTTYGFVKWTKYANKNNIKPENSKQINKNVV